MVVDCNHIQFADFTAANGLKDVVKQFQQRDQPIILWKVKPSVIRILSGVMPPAGEGGEQSAESFKFCRSETELEQIIGMISFSWYENEPWLDPCMTQFRTINLNGFFCSFKLSLDEESQSQSRATALEAKEMGVMDNVVVDAHTPHPLHREKFNSFPLN
jgi:hypothetical protein